MLKKLNNFFILFLLFFFIIACNSNPLPIEVKTINGRTRVCSKGETNLLLATNYDGNRLLIISISGYRELFSLYTGKNPGDIAVSPQGQTILVSNEGSNSISVFRRISGEQFDELGVVKVGVRPDGIIFNRTGNEAYVSVQEEGIIVVLDNSNVNVKPSIKGALRIPGPDPKPGKLVISSDDKQLFVTDINNKRIIEFKRNNITEVFTYNKTWKPTDTMKENLKLQGITIDKNNRLYVANSIDDSIISFDTSNIENIISIIKLNTKENEVVSPYKMVFNEKHDKLYITNKYNSTVSVIKNPSSILGTKNINEVGYIISLSESIDNNKNFLSSKTPEGIVLDSNQDILYVANGYGASLSVIDCNNDKLINNWGVNSSSLGAQIPLGDLKMLAGITNSNCTEKK